MMYQFAQLRHQGVSNPAHSMCNGGGSGGGSAPSNPDTRYANLDALYGTQNQASQYMLNNAMPYIPRLTENSAAMVDEAMNGTLGNRARGIAGADAEQAFSANMAAMDRSNAKFGAEFNPNRRAQLSRLGAMDGATGKANAMNKASQWAEDQKWNRNANFYGQVMGMNNGAMQGMSNAGAGLSNIANQQNANDRANAAGYGQAGAAFSNALFKADGGIIEGEAVRLADGGNAWEAYKAANPVRPMVTGGGSRRSGGNGFNQFIAGASPQMLGAGLKDIMNLDGKGGKIAKGAKEAWLKGKDLVNQYQSAQQAPSNTGLEFETNPDVVAGNVDTANAATEMGVSTMDAATSASAAADAGSAIGAASDVAAGADYMAAGTQAADAGGAAADWSSAIWAAKGGHIKKSKKGAQCLATGGMPSLQKMSVADNSGVAGLDSNSSLSLAKMDDPVKPNNAKPVATAPGYQGRTDGGGEMSPNDPDGFGSESGDKRHLAGTATLKVVGNKIFPFLGTVAGDAVADTIHPVMEQATRNAIVLGDKLGRETLGWIAGRDAGGFAGAFGMDPVGTVMSGKYFKDGGRIDYTPGGKVSGPGTETSDDIPAWLSDGEYVLNAEAVKMVGKKKLDKINKAGLKKRGDEDAKPGLKDADLALGSGGFANLGVALGAGVDQMNRQQMIDQRNQELEMRKQEAEQRRQEYEYQRQQRDAAAQAQAGARSAMEDATAMAGLPEQLRNRTDLTPEEKANAIRAYRDAGYTPEALAKKAGLELGKVDIGRGMELQNKLLAQQQAERRARVGGLLGAGDYAGLADVMSNNDFNPDGKAYKFNGVEKGKDGNEYVRFNVNGVDQRVDKRMLPGLVEASLDPSKGIEYTREVGKITDQDADRKVRNRQVDISAGHLGLANSKWAMEKEELTTERKVKAKIRELRESLSNTKDEAERESIKLKIADLDPSTDRGESNRYFLSNVDTGEQDQLGNPIKRTMRIDRKTGDVSDIKPTAKPQASSNFEIGKVYADAAGNKAKWNGKSWEPVK